MPDYRSTSPASCSRRPPASAARRSPPRRLRAAGGWGPRRSSAGRWSSTDARSAQRRWSERWPPVHRCSTSTVDGSSSTRPRRARRWRSCPSIAPTTSWSIRPSCSASPPKRQRSASRADSARSTSTRTTRRATTGCATCSPVCPTLRSRRGSSPTDSSPSSARTSAVGSAGCSSSPGSASAGASPTTWVSARPPPRSPTSSGGQRSAPGGVPAVGGAQLGERSGPVRARTRASMVHHGDRPATRRGARRRTVADADIVDHHLRRRRSRHRASRHDRVDDGGARRSAGGQEPPHQGRRGRAPAPGRPEARAHRHAGREPPRRAVVDPRRRRRPGCSAAEHRSASTSRRRSSATATTQTAAAAAPADVAVRAAAHEGRQDRSSPTSRTRSNRSPGRRSPASRRRCTRRSSISCWSTPSRPTGCAAVGWCSPRSPGSSRSATTRRTRSATGRASPVARAS